MVCNVPERASRACLTPISSPIIGPFTTMVSGTTASSLGEWIASWSQSPAYHSSRNSPDGYLQDRTRCSGIAQVLPAAWVGAGGYLGVWPPAVPTTPSPTAATRTVVDMTGRSVQIPTSSCAGTRRPNPKSSPIRDGATSSRSATTASTSTLEVQRHASHRGTHLVTFPRTSCRSPPPSDGDRRSCTTGIPLISANPVRLFPPPCPPSNTTALPS